VLIGLNKVDLPAAATCAQRLAPYRVDGRGGAGTGRQGRSRRRAGAAAATAGGRTTLILGPSGAGKSTLINLPGAGSQSAQVREISVALSSGKHTTTTTTWYWLDDARSGAVLDSPGFQEFGLRQVERCNWPA
jgi:ribosome biogenesis GTPase